MLIIKCRFSGIFICVCVWDSPWASFSLYRSVVSWSYLSLCVGPRNGIFFSVGASVVSWASYFSVCVGRFLCIFFSVYQFRFFGPLFLCWLFPYLGILFSVDQCCFLGILLGCYFSRCVGQLMHILFGTSAVSWAPFSLYHQCRFLSIFFTV